jgi:GH18 family chitinase
MYLHFCAYIQTILTRILAEQQGFLYHNYTHRTETQPNVLFLSLQAQYVIQKGLAGIMTWSLESEDFRNICEAGANPLITAINKEFGRLTKKLE